MKSNVSDYLRLVQAIYEDACAKCSADTSDLRDLLTIRSRTEQEGASFLTLTLPSFARDFEKSLADGFVDPASFRSFRKSGAIPAFLQGMLGQLFCQESGRIYEHNHDHSVIVEAVRQICLFFKKIEMPCAPEREQKAIDAFVQVERDLSVFALGGSDAEFFSVVANLLWRDVLVGVNPLDLIPKHGPGATAERILGNQKYVWRRWHERLEPYFPFFSTGYTLSAIGSKEAEVVTFVPVEQEQPVRVVLVPKTLKAPRIIAIEPACVQYTQQAIQGFLYEALESHWLSKGHVNFSDQSINQRLAVMASKDGRMATLDLSDASDRVPYQLALSMFDCNPDLRDAIDACRSRFAKLPGGRVIGPLSKFASMGSALCFPVEAMYFYTVCVMALVAKRNLPVTVSSLYAASRDVYVYGDDIIIPTVDADVVLDFLQRYNCKVNTSKSFWTGRFRESCGVDAYAGEPVTPTYLRKTVPKNKRQASDLISWVATANLLYLKGYWRTASLMFCTCERILGPLPYVDPLSSALGRVSFLGYQSVTSWNEDTQVVELTAWVPSPVYRCDMVDGYSALHKVLLSAEHRDNREQGATASYSLNSVEEHLREVAKDPLKSLNPSAVQYDHLERTAQYGAVTLKRRGVPVTIYRVSEG